MAKFKAAEWQKIRDRLNADPQRYGLPARVYGSAVIASANIRKLSASIDSRNTGSIKAYTAAGFDIETSLKDQFMHENGPSDKVYMACFNPNL